MTCSSGSSATGSVSARRLLSLPTRRRNVAFTCCGRRSPRVHVWHGLPSARLGPAGSGSRVSSQAVASSAPTLATAREAKAAAHGPPVSANEVGGSERGQMPSYE